MHRQAHNGLSISNLRNSGQINLMVVPPIPLLYQFEYYVTYWSLSLYVLKWKLGNKLWTFLADGIRCLNFLIQLSYIHLFIYMYITFLGLCCELRWFDYFWFKKFETLLVLRAISSAKINAGINVKSKIIHSGITHTQENVHLSIPTFWEYLQHATC